MKNWQLTSFSIVKIVKRLKPFPLCQEQNKDATFATAAQGFTRSFNQKIRKKKMTKFIQIRKYKEKLFLFTVVIAIHIFSWNPQGSY